ncbi:MAG: LamB/YcsF family protein, partial [Pseudonocardiales bacterium]|nr:LamB/YcsF family protein [Pseudonocardiales bacterium]
GYRADGTLVPRGEPGALFADADEVGERARRLATDGELVAVDGTVLAVAARSVCVHGDTPGAVQLAAAVRAELQRSGVELAPFVRTGADLAQ